MRKNILLSSFILCLSVMCFAQPAVPDSANVIRQAKPLVVDTQGRVFRIVHIGDSHIQADWFSGRVRDLLQGQYGNAGKGLIFPYRQIRTNGPNTFNTFSKVPFKASKIVKCRSTCDVGIAAYNAFMYAGNSLAITLKRDTSLQYVSMLYQSGPGNQHVRINSDADTSHYHIQQAAHFSIASYSELVQPTFSMQALTDVTLNGLIASNGQPGVLYYTIGANGATFDNYTHSPVFFEQLQALQPDLVIVSLGTNESVSDLSSDTLTARLRLFNQQLSGTCGHQNIIYTLPADNYRKKSVVIRTKYKGKWRKRRVIRYMHNPKLEEVRQCMLNFCSTESLMYWDLYEIMGGHGSMKNWVNTGYASKDHIHFSKTGYEFQGDLFYKALQRIIVLP